jgi:hypothetical protein
MPKRKVMIDFTSLRDVELDQNAEEIITALTGNANFPTPHHLPGVIVTDFKRLKNS